MRFFSSSEPNCLSEAGLGGVVSKRSLRSFLKDDAFAEGGGTVSRSSGEPLI
jgi:hypothetical protein